MTKLYNFLLPFVWSTIVKGSTSVTYNTTIWGNSWTTTSDDSNKIPPYIITFDIVTNRTLSYIGGTACVYVTNWCQLYSNSTLNIFYMLYTLVATKSKTHDQSWIFH